MNNEIDKRMICLKISPIKKPKCLRTSTPIPIMEQMKIVHVDTPYYDFRRYLHMPPAKPYKIRGIRNLTNHFISGHIVMNKTKQKIIYEERNEALERRVTPEEYEEKLDARNKSIRNKIIPLLQKGLEKLKIPKEKPYKKIKNVSCNDDYIIYCNNNNITYSKNDD